MPSTLIAGSGVAGLSAARMLAADGHVTVIDRLPAIGGAVGWRDPVAQHLEQGCRDAGVEFLLGTTALRWQDHRLLVARPGEIRWLSGDRLVCATGSRPATPAELRLLGARLAGVVSATVAKHLLEARVRLGQRPLIVGVGGWAAEIAAMLHRQALQVGVVAKSPLARPVYADEWWPGWRAARVQGAARVQELTIERDGHRLRILCDAVVLADEPRPLRNIEGAVLDGKDVTYIQNVEPHATAEAIAAEAAELARRMRSVP